MSLPTCSSDRPGAETHRTFYVPQSFVDAASVAAVQSWTAKLCCTFNHAEITDESVPYLITYAGFRRHYTATTTFEEAAAAAHNDVCGMSMGSNDCANEAACVADAEAMLEAGSGPPPMPEPLLACCMAMPTCPAGECWAGFDCYEQTLCCSTIECQGPMPTILLILGPSLLLLALVAFWCWRKHRRSAQLVGKPPMEPPPMTL